MVAAITLFYIWCLGCFAAWIISVELRNHGIKKSRLEVIRDTFFSWITVFFFMTRVVTYIDDIHKTIVRTRRRDDTKAQQVHRNWDV